MRNQTLRNEREHQPDSQLQRIIARWALILMLAVVTDAALILFVVPNVVAIYSEFGGR